MPTTIEQKLKISADDRDVKKLGQSIGQALDKRTVKEFQLANKDLEGQLIKLTRKQLEYTRALEGVKRGTKHYKDLAKELRGVRREADMVAKSMSQIDRVMRESDQQRKRRQGFVAGLGQGVGVAQYIPTGPGMMPRMAGAMLGRGMRRAAGAAAAPFAMPGLGGMATGLQGIPGVGGFLGGALQQAAGAYQATVAFDQARLRNLAFAGPQMGTRGGIRANPAYVAQQELIGAAEGEREEILNKQGRLQGDQRRLNEALRSRGGRDKATQNKRFRDRARVANTLEKMGVKGRPGAFAAVAAQTGVVAKPENTAEIQQRRLKQDIGTNKAALETSNRQIDQLRRSGRNISKTIQGGRLTGLAPTAMGGEFGIMPEQTQQMLGQFFTQRGGLFEQGGRSGAQFQEALAAMTRRGVSMQQAGGFARMGMAGGGGAMGGMNLSQVLANATQQGLEGSQVTEYLQTLVQLGTQAEKMGIKINVREFVKSSAQMTAIGLQGVQAQRVAGGLQQAGMRVSRQGVQGPMDVIMARAAGFDPSQGSEGYAKAMNKLAGGMSSEMINNLLGMVTQGAGAGGFGPEMQRMMVRRAFGKMGVQIGPGQASLMLENYQAGKEVTLASEEVEVRRGKKMVSMTRRQALIAEAKEGAGVVGGTAVGAARIQAMRIGVGRGAAGFVQRFEINALEAGRVINKFGADLSKLSGYVSDAMKEFKDLAEGGLTGVFKRLLKSLVAPIPEGSP